MGDRGLVYGVSEILGDRCAVLWDVAADGETRCARAGIGRISALGLVLTCASHAYSSLTVGSGLQQLMVYEFVVSGLRNRYIRRSSKMFHSQIQSG